MTYGKHDERDDRDERDEEFHFGDLIATIALIVVLAVAPFH
jgi:hypothetical protein